MILSCLNEINIQAQTHRVKTLAAAVRTQFSTRPALGIAIRHLSADGETSLEVRPSEREIGDSSFGRS
jgi:hypothetical protein